MNTSETPPTSAMQQARATKNWLRKLYFWTLHWAETKYALPALFVISFAESSFFPIPPDVLLMAICFTAPKRWLAAATICTVASTLGGLFGYFIGWGLYETIGHPLVQLYNGEPIMEKIQTWYTEFGFWGILVAAVTPIPYKVFTIASGVFSFNIWIFTAASLLGRGLRFYAVAAIIRTMGPKVRPLLERYLEPLLALLLILAVLGFVALKFIPH